MLNTSQDLLYLVIAFAVLWLSIFFCWLIYYLILILRDVHGVTREVKEKVEWFGDLVKTIKEKLHSSTATAALLMRSALELVNYYRSRTIELKTETPAEEKKKGKKIKLT